MLFCGQKLGERPHAASPGTSCHFREVPAIEPALIAICGVIAAIWAIGKTTSAIRTLHAHRRNADSQGRGGDYSGSYGVGGIDPGGGHGGHGHGGGDCGGAW